jgi:hypothetical protein
MRWSAAAAAWNAIGGLSNAKELLLNLMFPLLPMLSYDVERDLKILALGNNRNDGSNGAYGEEIGMIRMGYSKWSKTRN